ncbi:YbjN domain-containing protein [Muricauda oceani]|uniref:YbjN domain-containing protein n=1 Tax=Flagellimonas oceani TaxID=2698672 RepID=A0A6G7IYM5_9FLAO|nr:YbjN domain-containing protein [Allomuricauda oceani]MBW8244658.1 YbjN domain-containing protein [Allomuricauda oceani]QII43713.1 YbjN domain-containing protein [Allomuricauda oceani]
MKHVLPRFARPIKSENAPLMDVSYWSKAIDAYDAKEHRTALIETINYINSNVLKGHSSDKDIEVAQGQGSAEIRISITKDILSIKVPFVKTTEKTNKIALFRRVAEINFNPLTLAQIHLRNNALWFEYETPIELCQPYKVYDLLREISVYADNYDDEFIEKYNAEFYKEPRTTPLSEEEKEAVWQQISDILEDYNNYSLLFKEKRWNDFQWDIIVISLLKIVNIPCVHGTLRTKLEEYVNNLFNGQIDFNHRIDKGVNFMQKLLTKPKEEFMEDIYHAEALISLKWRSSTEILQDYAKNLEQYVNSYVKENNNLMLCYYLQYSFLKMIYNYNLEERHQNVIYDTLEKISGKELHDARPILLNTFNAFLNGTAGNTGEKKKEKRGLFSKLFS